MSPVATLPSWACGGGGQVQVDAADATAGQGRGLTRTHPVIFFHTGALHPPGPGGRQSLDAHSGDAALHLNHLDQRQALRGFNADRAVRAVVGTAQAITASATFSRLGVPMKLTVWAVSSLLIPLFWPFYPG